MMFEFFFVYFASFLALVDAFVFYLTGVRLYKSIINFKLHFRSDIENDTEIIALRYKAHDQREKILPSILSVFAVNHYL